MGIFRFFVCLFLLLLSSASFASEIDLETGLVAHYKFDGDFTDSSGTANHGAQQGGVTFVEGVDGQAAYFDGNDDYIIVPHSDSLALNRSLTLSIRLKPSYQQNEDCNECPVTVFTKDEHLPNNFSLWTEVGLQRIYFQQYGEGILNEDNRTEKVPVSFSSVNFHEIVVVKEISMVSVYFDGNKIAEKNLDYDAVQQSGPLYIGYDGGWGYGKYKGVIDDLKIYDRALSDSEVIALATSPIIFSQDNEDIGLSGIGTQYDIENTLNGNISFSEDTLTVTNTSGVVDSVRSIHSISSGKHYWEVTAHCGPDSLGFETGVIATGSQLVSIGNKDNSDIWAILSDGAMKNSPNYQVLSEGFLQTYANDTFQVAVDLDNNKIYYGKNGLWLGGADPELSLNPAADDLSDEVYAFFWLGNRECSTLSATTNFGATQFKYDVPAGYYKGFCPTGGCLISGQESDDNDQAKNEIITMTGAAYAGDVWVLDINYPISKTITYVAGSIATGKNILNAAIGFAAQINADPDASQILTAIAVDSTEGYAAEVHLQMIEGVDGFDASVSVTGNNDRELSVSITNNLILNDIDSDEDGILNSFDVFPYDSTEWLDTDLDGIGNNTDVDDDNDGILDIVDIWPEDTRYSKDTDMDGMPDSYEELYQFNIYDASDATYDPDEDGMGAFSEFLLNTSPRYWDSDGDGQPDASDDANDYVIDLSSDTDNDGLVNSEEILLRTSYKNSDTDSDGMPDGWEIENNRNPIIADYQVSSGNDHTCALDDTGVVCWGNNLQGQIDVPQLLNPTQISAGFNHNCAIDDTGVVCWGSNSHGQTNVPNLISPKFVKSNRYYSCAVDAYEVKCWGHINGLPENVSTSEEIILGHSFVCGINKGELICSGSNSDGQLNLPNERYVSDVSLGNNHGCAVFDGDVKCWGRNHFGMAEPTVLNNPTVISVNRVHSCAVDSAGVKCWGRGDNFSGMPELNGVLQLSAGDEHTCAIDNSGVHCWGHNDAGERDVPELIFDFDRDGYKNNHDIFPLDSAEQQDTDDDGIGNNADTDDDGDGIEDGNDAFPLNSLYSSDSDNDNLPDAWEILYGLNPNDPTDTASDQDNDGSVALQEFYEGTLPVPDSDGDEIFDNSDNCPDVDNPDQLDTDGDSIGDACDPDADNDGLLNDYETANGLNPVDASDAQSDSDMDGLTALEEYTAGTSLTNDDTDRDTLPDGWEVENGRDPLIADYQVSSGLNHTCALDDSGVVCWGSNDEGQTTVPALTNPSQLSSGYRHNCALDDSGVVCWGLNDNGQTNVPVLSNPTQVSSGGNHHTCALDDSGVVCWGLNGIGQTNVPSLSNPTQVASGYDHNCALDDTGVVCWGKNTQGQSNVPVLSNPTQVSSGGYEHTCALDDSGVHCWGWNPYNQTDVPALSKPTQVSAGGHHTCALDDSGVVCWGYNGYGQTDVPLLSNPSQLSSGYRHTCALDDSGVVCWGLNDYGQTNVPNLVIDPDNDGFLSHNNSDAFPLDPNEWHDTDFDGVGNNADIDDDNDGFADTYEIANNLDSLVANLDIDNDGIANELDADNDNDGIEDDYDALPIDSTEYLDTDSDGIGNNSDVDDDGDGVNDTLDLFPLEPNESADSDGDGVGDNADFFPNSAEYSLDSDLDQMPDAWERKYGLNPTDASDALLDQDNDGLTALEEYEAGTIPLKILDIDANGSFDALTDGLIILRYAFGLRGENLVRSATAGDAMRTDAADVEAYLNSLVPDL